MAVGATAVIVTGPSPAFAMPEHGGSDGCSTGLVPATMTPIYGHIEKAHLERSPMQQASDAQATSDYVAMHEAWIEMFTAPALTSVPAAGESALSAFMAHLQKAHIERSATDQVADISDIDQYVLMHTMLVEMMTQSGAESLGACS